MKRDYGASNEASPHISKVTPKMLEDFRNAEIDYLDRTIEMYIKRYHHKFTLQRIGDEYGLTRERVRTRLNQMKSKMNVLLAR